MRLNNATIKERIIAYSYPITEAGCHIWMGGTNRYYGVVRIGKKTEGNRKMGLAHRVAYEIFKGDIPDNLEVCHSCDQPLCVNPDHLFLGSRTDNVRDCIKKNRHRWRNRTHCTKGHELTLNNLVTRELPIRKRCKICNDEYRQQYYKKQTQHGEFV